MLTSTHIICSSSLFLNIQPTPPPTQYPTRSPVIAVDPNAFDGFIDPPLDLATEPFMAEGATVDGVLNCISTATATGECDTNPLNGGVILNPLSEGTPGGQAELERVLSTTYEIESSGPRVLGPFNCAGMTGYECCLLAKHQVRDSDVNGRALQCHLDYDDTTCKKAYELDQAEHRKVWIYANHKYYVAKDPKISNTWDTCGTKWGKERDWSEKDSSWSNAPTPTTYGVPSPPPTSRPTPKPTPSPIAADGSTAPPIADLVPSTLVPCPDGYTCMQNDDFGIDDPDGFKIDLVTETLFPESAEAYKFAVRHWEEIINGNLEGVSTLGMEDDGCTMPYPDMIDDLFIWKVRVSVVLLCVIVCSI